MTTTIISKNEQKITVFHKRALDYAKVLQWPVFPVHTIHGVVCTCGNRNCKNAGKHPKWDKQLIPDGLLSATKNPEIINKWFTKWPDANIAVPTGEVSGFIAVDIDPRHGGNQTWDDLIQEHGTIPDTVEALTGGGGRHILFKHPGQKVTSNQNGEALGPGVDVKGDGGYIIVSPSLHESGGRYEWEYSSLPSETPIAEMPDWIKKKVMQKEGEGKQGKIQSSYWLEVMQGVGEGQRNTTATQVLGHLLRRYVDPFMAWAIFEMWNERNDPPLSEKELHSIFNSIYSTELKRRKGGGSYGFTVRTRRK